MKEFVLMSKRDGELFVGYRVTFMDAFTAGVTQSAKDKVWTIGVLEQHGWVLETPRIPYTVFMNMHGEKFFEVLGEL